VVNLEDCLSAELRALSPTITRIAAGLSGAGVYRVEAGDRAYVLKVLGDGEPLADWRRKCHVVTLAADAGVAPRVVHVDEARRAIVSEFIVDRSIHAYFANPATHAAAVAELGRMFRRVHDLPPPPELAPRDARLFLAMIHQGLSAAGVLPAFVRELNQGVIDTPPPAHDRAPVLSHNDANPSNLIYDGQQIMLLDWDMAGLNDDYYDLAAVALFLRMDEPTSLALLSAHDGAPVTRVPPRFAYDRKLVACLCGTIFLHLARTAGHPGPSDRDTLDNAATLVEVYPRMRTGELDLASALGRWMLGLALIKESTLL
jgi:aminoglycoside phosphotransferase (APT) family kinase protein